MNLIIGTVMPLFFMAMAWSSAHAGLRSLVMSVCKWMEAVAVSWQEGKFMFISRNGRTEVAVHRKCVFAVDMKGLFCTFWGRQSQAAEWTSGLVAGATFDYKNRLFWAHLQWDRQNSTAKLFCLLSPTCVAKYFCTPRWNGRELHALLPEHACTQA